jgi:hypothetical protein
MLDLIKSGEFWSAIAGAVVGGLIAFGIQWIGFRETRKAAKEDEKLKKQSLAYSLLFKIIEMDSIAHNIMGIIDECITEWKQLGREGGGLWQIVKPIPNLPRQVLFSAEEMAMLLSLKSDKVFNQVLMMDARFNSTIESFRFYGELKQAFKQTFPPNHFDKGMATFVATGNEVEIVKSRIHELDQLISVTIENLKKDLSATDLALKPLSELFEHNLDIKLSIKRKQIARA